MRSTRRRKSIVRPAVLTLGVLLSIVVGAVLIFHPSSWFHFFLTVPVPRPAGLILSEPTPRETPRPPPALAAPDVTRLPTVTPAPLTAIPLLLAATPTVPVSTPTPRPVVRAGHGGPVVHTAPNAASPALSGLYLDTYLTVRGQQTDAQGVLWYQVKLWGTLTGWIRADQTETGPPPSTTPRTLSAGGGVPTSAAPVALAPSPIYPLNAQGITTDLVNLRSDANISANQITVLDAGTKLQVQAWRTDDQSSPWYQVVVGGQSGWVWAGAVTLTTPAPARVSVGGQPIWSAITGKGMWLPTPLLRMANPDAIVAAARDLGLTHIYLEVGDSQRGFYGQNGLDRLLPVAHHAGIKVIGWVLTSLDDLPTDVTISTTAANYRTPSGDRLDGLAADIEQNMDPTDVAAFSQILRADLGTDYLIVGVIYPAGTWIGQRHPVAATLSQSFNALAPMDYWHDTARPYTSDEIARFIRHSVTDIHDAVGDPNYPVAVIGQSYDAFGRDGTGPNNPTGAEVATMLQAAKQAGAVGVSLFQWGTTTPAEWNALAALHWP